MLLSVLWRLTDIEKLGHISGAFIATILVFSGYVLWHPFANKLKQNLQLKLRKRLIIDCLLMLQEGTYPFIMKNVRLLQRFWYFRVMYYASICK